MISSRRVIFAGLVVVTWGLSLWLAAAAVAPGGWSPLVVAILVLFALQVPWTIIGFWNSAIGFLIARFAADPLGLCCPPAKAGDRDLPLTSSTAVLACIRNEDPEAVFARLDALAAELARTGEAGRFDLYVLSDTSVDAIALREETLMAGLERRWLGTLRGVTYRRRLSNPGFKAGNIRDFCLRWGSGHDFALVLDADSFMSGDKIVAITRVMEAEPRLGILQCLTVGLPSLSPLARLFQFGMRLGMRSYTLGGSCRVQLLLAIWLFLASACNVGLWSLILVKSLNVGGGDWLVAAPALWLVAALAVMSLAPKIATAMAVVLDPAERAAYGGVTRFATGFLVELVFSFLITPIMAVSQTAAIVALCFGRTIGWTAQVRSEHAVTWADAASRFWPHTLFGLVVAAGLVHLSVAAMLWSLPVYVGLVVAIPLTVMTSVPAVGQAMARLRLCSIPEEILPPSEFAGLDLPALRLPHRATMS
eukprot:gene20549-21209_t